MMLQRLIAAFEAHVNRKRVFEQSCDKAVYKDQDVMTSKVFISRVN